MLRQSDNSEAAVAIRPLQPRDVTFLTDLWVESWQEAMPEIDFETRRDWIGVFLNASAHLTLVADTGVRSTGFAILEGVYLHQLVVATAAKGGGTAARLLDAAKARAPKGLKLDVNQTNSRAVHFYEREDFVIEDAGLNEASGLPTWRMHWRAP